MIKYQLRCDGDHEFEGWFRNSADFDIQAADGTLSCPACGSAKIGKAIMAPAVASSEAKAQRVSDMRRAIAEAAARARAYVERNFDYVGDRFPEEARKIHYGESNPRGIYGEASGAEVKALIEEGVEVAPLPGAAKADAKTTASSPAAPGAAAAKKTLN
ncbi:MAG: DUF1178 family protein [Parvularculaceae bacterium]|nr:DUF1178 family protein [Parvularculaceae bacterium]